VQQQCLARPRFQLAAGEYCGSSGIYGSVGSQERGEGFSFSAFGRLRIGNQNHQHLGFNSGKGRKGDLGLHGAIISFHPEEFGVDLQANGARRLPECSAFHVISSLNDIIIAFDIYSK
jgi:hypothetical protein